MGTPFKMKGSPMARNFGAPFKQDFKQDKSDGITKGDGGYSYKIDYRANEGNIGDGMTDLVHRAPHIYSSKDGGEFSQVEHGSDAYKAIKKKHYSPKFKAMPMPPNGKKGNINDAMEFM